LAELAKKKGNQPMIKPSELSWDDIV